MMYVMRAALICITVWPMASACSVRDAPDTPAAPATPATQISPSPSSDAQAPGRSSGSQFIARDFARFTRSRLQAISVVSEDVFWVSGLDGYWGKTADGGESWVSGQIPGAESLQLRDIHAFDDGVAFAMSAGAGDESRIYRTDDGGVSWREQWVMPEVDGFLDCFDFWSPKRGLAYGDSIDGQLYLLQSDDGRTWRRVSPGDLPAAVGKEGGFAASGTCVRVDGDSAAWIGTGAGDRPRVLHTEDGVHWEAVEVPIVAGDAAGVMTVALGAEGMVVVLGGDLERRETRTSNVAWSADGGSTWSRSPSPGFLGPIYGADMISLVDGVDLAAAGPAGLDLSIGGLDRWSQMSRSEYWAVAFLGPNSLVAVGPEGRITRFSW